MAYNHGQEDRKWRIWKEADHNHLLIDDKVAHVVREIFDLALAGNGNRSEQGESIRERTA